MPFPPLGTLYAAALMRKNNFDVDLFDTNLLNSPKSIISEKNSFSPWSQWQNNYRKMSKLQALKLFFLSARVGRAGMQDALHLEGR